MTHSRYTVASALFFCHKENFTRRIVASCKKIGTKMTYSLQNNLRACLRLMTLLMMVLSKLEFSESVWVGDNSNDECLHVTVLSYRSPYNETISDFFNNNYLARMNSNPPDSRACIGMLMKQEACLWSTKCLFVWGGECL